MIDLFTGFLFLSVDLIVARGLVSGKSIEPLCHVYKSKINTGETAEIADTSKQCLASVNIKRVKH